MGRYAKEPDGGDFEQPPAGTHVGVCFRIIDLGTQHSEYEGKETIRNQVLVSWELPQETMLDGRPFSVSRFYTNSLSEKANLRKDLAGWRGRDFTTAELERFDLSTILGKGCLVSVILDKKNKAKVNAVLALPKGTPTPKPVNAPHAFFIEEWDELVWQGIPKGIQAIVERSDEYGWLRGGKTKPADPDEIPPPAEEEDIPF